MLFCAAFDEDSLHGSITASPSTSTVRFDTSAQKPAEATVRSITVKQQAPPVPAERRTLSSANFSIDVMSQQTSDDGYYVKEYRPRTASAKSASSRTVLQNEIMMGLNTSQAATQPPTPMKLQATEISRAYEPWSTSQTPSKMARRSILHQQQSLVPACSQGVVPACSQGLKVQFDKNKAADTSVPPAEASALPHHSSVDKGETAGVAAAESKKPKGILRKISKYAPRAYMAQNSQQIPMYPIYHSTSAIARQQWVNKLSTCGTIASEPKRSRPEDCKSVKWHEVQYNDGTSATITESGLIVPNQPAFVQSSVSATAQKPAKAGGKGKAAKGGKDKGKKGAAAKPEKAGKGAGAGGRKLKPAEKAGDLALEPHPPPTKKKQLTTTNALHYSIHDEAPSSTPTSSTSMPQRSKIAWNETADQVTLDTLKSNGGGCDSGADGQGGGKRKTEVITTEKIGNHVSWRQV